MREAVPGPAPGVDEFSPTVAPTAAPATSRATEAATGVPARPDDGADVLIGRVLADRYRIDHRLGAGGMGAVYVGLHTALAKRVAVKVIQPRLGADPTIAQRFVQEARAASAIGHEHIVQITDFGATAEGGSFLVMEYLEGEDLSETLRREGPLPWSRVIHIGEQIAWALAAAHRHGIVHRDIKPANCYRVPREHDPDFIKVLDFGLAKVMIEGRRDGESLTHTGMLLGTPGYIAPELYRGLKADHRVDIYALGALMYKLLTGELPPMGGGDEHEPLPGLPAPDVVAAALARALREHPEQRWPSAQELAQALRAIPRPRPDAPTLPQRLADDPGAARTRDLPTRPEPGSAATAREPTPVSFSSLVTVERQGSRLRFSLGVPALLMLIGLVGLVVWLATRKDELAGDLAVVTAPPVAAPPPAPAAPAAPDPKPAPPQPPPDPAPAGPVPPDFAATPPDPAAPVPSPPEFVAPPPASLPAADPAREDRRRRGLGRLKREARLACEIEERSLVISGNVEMSFRTDADARVLPGSVQVRLTGTTAKAVDPACVKQAILACKQTWDPDESYATKISIKQSEAG